MMFFNEKHSHYIRGGMKRDEEVSKRVGHTHVAVCTQRMWNRGWES